MLLRCQQAKHTKQNPEMYLKQVKQLRLGPAKSAQSAQSFQFVEFSQMKKL